MIDLVTANHLSKRYKGRPALDDFTLQIPSGKIIGLMGPNGSGKTTLIKLLAGLLTPTSGEALIEGQAPGPWTKSIVSYLPDHLTVPEWMKVQDFVTYYEDFFEDFDRERAEKMLSLLQIDGSMLIKNLSKGTKEKLQLILAMSRRAHLYLLDEPIAGVDPAARDYILKTIIRNYEENASILLSTHLISDVENILDDVIFIRDGRLERFASVDELRDEKQTSIDHLFREEFKC